MRDALPGTFAGEVILPGEPGYDAARAVWNGMVDRRPAIVVRPEGSSDVAAAVRFARDRDLLIAVRGGGHSIPGLSTCDGGIVIDLSRLRGVAIDSMRRTARVAGGSLLGELDDAAQAFGLVCPVGVVSHTGVGGLTLGGGMGRLQRKLGYTIDNLFAVELVTADAHIVRASEDENPELLWGLRGAGANFGVATAFEFRLHPLDPVVTFGAVVHPLERATELAALYRHLAETSSDELWLSFGIGLSDPDSQPVTKVSVHHCGTIADAERDLAELRAFGPPAADSIAAMPYLDVQHLNDDAMDWGHRFYMKSAFLPALPDAVVERCVEHAGRVPTGADGSFSFWSCGRATAAVPEAATAFTGRAAAVWAAVEIQWDDPALDDECRSWVRAATADIEPHALAGRYVNDEADAEAGLARAIYGEAKYERLVTLKRAWDPENVFRLNQNIAP